MADRINGSREQCRLPFFYTAAVREERRGRGASSHREPGEMLYLRSEPDYQLIMAKKFNVTGTCIPGQHYIADTSGKLRQILDMVEAGNYFIINRPRQYGKTTTLFLLVQRLRQSSEYLPIRISFAGVGDDVFLTEKAFCNMFLDMLESRVRQQGPEALADFLLEESHRTTSLKELSKSVAKLAAQSGKRVVLMIDEVDKSSNNQLFISFLALLRE